MATVKMTGCMNLVARMSEEDQDFLLRRLDEYIAQGIPPQRAQGMAVADVLAEVRAERAEFESTVREQHPDAFPEAAPELAANEPDSTEAPAEPTEPAAIEQPPRTKNSKPATSTRTDYTPEQRAALEKVYGKADDTSLVDRIRGAISDPKGAWELIKAWAVKARESFIRNVLDQYRPILTKLGMKSYILARLSTSGSGTLEAQMFLGKVITKDGMPDVVFDGKGGFFGEMAPVIGGEIQDFLKWVAALRMEKLLPQGKENLADREAIEALKTLADGTMGDGRDRRAQYEKALVILNEYNDAAISRAVAAGLVSETLRQRFKDDPYVPFYRDWEGDGTEPPRYSESLTGQKPFEKLTGGTALLNDDLLGNLLHNWSHLFSASAKNVAANAALDEMVAQGVAVELPERAKGSVWTMQRGELKFWDVKDQDLAASISAMHYVMPSWQRPLASFKRILTHGVTSLPDFKVKNLIRDTVQALALDENLSANALKNLKTGNEIVDMKGALANLANTVRGKAPASFYAQNQTFATMLAQGGVMHMGSGFEGSETHQAQASIRRATGKGVILDRNSGHQLLNMIADTWEGLNSLGEIGESINRAALFKAMTEMKNPDGTRKYSDGEASFMARDLMDFSLQGASPVIRFLVQTVPFLNARLQGLYKLGRAATSGDTFESVPVNKRFAAVAGGVAMASLALWLMYRDDKDWKEREDWDRDSYWWFKIGGTAFRIPKPFEVGSIGTIAERTAELTFDRDMTFRRYKDRLTDMAMNTFAFNPTPQFAKPLIDVYANKDSFSGRPIETAGMTGMRPEDRADDRTTLVARAIGALGLPQPLALAQGKLGANDPKISPAQADFLIAAYFGGLGTTLTGMVDWVGSKSGLTPGGERPSWTLKRASASFIEELPASSSRYVQTFYERAEQVSQVYASYRHALNIGDAATALKIVAENPEAIGMNNKLQRVKASMAKISQQMARVANSTSLSAETKRTQLDQLSRQRADLAETVDEALTPY